MEDYFSSAELSDGEQIGLGAVEITSVPDLSVLQGRYPADADIEGEYQRKTGSLLTELFQVCQTAWAADAQNEAALELLWVTAPVENQPYRAKIRLFLVLRALDAGRSGALETVRRMTELCESSLRTLRYETQRLSGEELQGVLSAVPEESVKAVTREERLENLQNQVLPLCYAFDRFFEETRDLSGLVNSLIDHPNCAVSVQLIPTRLTPAESAALSQIGQMLDTLNRGIMTPGMGNISAAGADQYAQLYRYYSDNKNSALFSYNLLIEGDSVSVAELATKVYGSLSYHAGKAAALQILTLRPEDVQRSSNFYPLPWAVSELLVNSGRSPQIWNGGQSSFQNLYRMPYIVTAAEAAALFRLPIGTQSVSAGLPVSMSGGASKTYTDNLINAGDIQVGTLKSSGRRDTIGISLKDLTKHMLVVGTPGSGKTTFSVSLLDRLWRDHHIPFLVIEPAKNEYRALVQSIPDLQVFTPGKNFISPFVFNPFVPPKNVRLETYKSTLKTAFAAAVSMTTPLDKIFEESINNCYSDFRWLDTYTSDDAGRTFNISDFIRCFQETFDQIGYTGDAKNIGRAGVVRLNSLVNLFDNYSSIPIEDLLKKPTVIELAAIENGDQKALIISLLLLSILAYVNANYVGEGSLRNVILLEEAHVLLDAESNAQADANPSAIAQGLVKRMLAEIRSYGVGLIIADQSPRKVSTDVVALTDMKMVFRLVEATDKEIIANSTNMDEAQVQRMSRLKPGEAFLFFNRLDEPEEIVTPDYRLEQKISITLSDEEIGRLTTYWDDKGDRLRPYPQCGEVRYCAGSCDYGRRILAREIARRIFVRNFKPDSKDFALVRQVFGKISKLVQAELNDEPFTPELLACVKAQLWRRIRYGTKIPVTDQQITNSLEKA